MRITVVGGHGKVALLAAPLLVQDGHEVHAIIRNPDHMTEVAQTGATPVIADVEKLDVAALTSLFEGSDAVVGRPARVAAIPRAPNRWTGTPRSAPSRRRRTPARTAM